MCKHIEIFTTDHKDDTLSSYCDMYDRYMVEGVYKDIKYFPSLPSYREVAHYIVAISDNRIIGALKLRIDGGKGDHGYKRWVNFISVAPAYQGQGVARALIVKMFEHCKKENIQNIIQSSYTKEGMQKVAHIFTEISEKYPEVKFKDKLRYFTGG